jgi:hypothetical protein
LAKLTALRDCLLIYDYSSFPQDPSSEGLKLILQDMTRLIKNVVVLKSSEYIERGWCLYEYIVASLNVTVVCDEVNDPEFVKLRRWSSTRAPLPTSFKGHSFESSIQNAINQAVIQTVDRIRPQYVESKFTVEADRTLVTNLLIDKLMEALPSRKEYPSPYLGEWVDKPWQRDELSLAFTGKLNWDDMKSKWDHVGTYDIKPNELDVPFTIEEAVRRRYNVERPPRMSELEGVSRAFLGLLGSGRKKANPNS